MLPDEFRGGDGGDQPFFKAATSDGGSPTDCQQLAHAVGRLAATMSKRYNARMNHELKITKIGNSAGVVLPKDVLAHLDTAIGQTDRKSVV